jgi:hypothetical protein
MFLPFPPGVRLGAPSSVVFPDSRVASSDGLLVVDQTYENPGTAGSDIVLGVSDGQVVAGCSVELSGADFDPVEAQYASFCMPVRNGTRYNVIGGAADDTPAQEWTAGMFFPFVGSVFPNAPEERDIDTTYTAQSDGLLFGHLHCEEGPRGSILVRVGAADSDPTQAPALQAASAQRFGGASVYIIEASIIVPLGKGQTYHVESQWTADAPQPSLFWIDLAPADG